MMILRSDLNIHERIIVVHSSSSKAYQRYTKNGHVFIDESLEVARKEVPEIKELLENQRDSLNSELAEEHPFHESNNLKEDDADDEPDEGPGPLDSSEQR